MKKVFQQKNHLRYRAIYRGANNYGASVIKTPFSYGSKDGLFELGVIKFNSEDNFDYQLIYNTDLTPNEDVIGYLSEKDIEKILKEIDSLTEDGKLPKDINYNVWTVN